MLFTDNLHNILKEIYWLSHHVSMSTDYIESLSPLDRKLYWAYWMEEQSAKEKENGTYNILDGNIPSAMNMQGLQ